MIWGRTTRAVAIAAVGATLAVAPVALVGAVPALEGDGRSPRGVDDPAVTSGLAWHLEATDAAFAWRSSLGVGTTVAIVDSGIDADHPDLAGQVVRSVSCIGAAGDPDRCATVGADDGVPSTDHGTHVAGLVAARADDGIGVAGVAPRSKLLIARALGADCAASGCVPVGDTADVAAAVRWSVANGADVVNLSLTSGRRLGPELAAAIEEAWAAGAAPVLAAGNRSNVIGFGEVPSAIVVTATARSGERAPYAPRVDGSPLGVAAPGGIDGDTERSCRIGGVPEGIISTSSRAGDGSGYACLAGTSMAAPQVSGGLALLLSMGFTRDQAVDRLLGTARPGAGLGAGEIDLAAATAPPLPRGVVDRPSRFDTGAPQTEAAAVSTGPFATTSVGPGERVPRWLWVPLGGLVAGLVVDVAYRLHERRRVQQAASALLDP